MKTSILLFFALIPITLLADVRLPALISDNMVLQSGGANVWGNADPGEKIAVKLVGKQFRTEAGANGKWAVTIPGSVLQSGETYEMTITGKNQITVHNVVAGEVWVGSGQSNMGWSVEKSQNAAAEIAAANYPMIRLFKVDANAASDEPLDDCGGKWLACSPQTVPAFSGVAYFFAREIHNRLKAPVGIIQSSWGGTPAQAWTPRDALEADPELKPILEAWQKMQEAFPSLKQVYDKQLAEWQQASNKAVAAGHHVPTAPVLPKGEKKSNRRPCALYNGMIAPLMSFSIKGVIWDQGEANVTTGPAYRHPLFMGTAESNRAEGRGKVYRKLFPTLIDSWRKGWGDPDLPFYFTQLANIHSKQEQPSESDWAITREAQAMALRLPHTGMAVVIDIGEAKTIHPLNKQDVGKRLAAIALAKTYGLENVIASGPVFVSMHVEGETVTLAFQDASGALVARNGTPLKGFAVAGADKKFHWAQAEIKGLNVVLTCRDVPKPVAVRYGWADNPDCDLINRAGLPASPFRTDDWD